jgi:hypothetical protein
VTPLRRRDGTKVAAADYAYNRTFWIPRFSSDRSTKYRRNHVKKLARAIFVTGRTALKER